MTRSRVLSLLFSFSLIVLVGVGVSPVTRAQSDVPPLLSHQGRLFDVLDNSPLVGVQRLTFRIYDGPDAGAEAIWGEAQDVLLSNGYYSVVLGALSAIPDRVFDGSTRYLGIVVGDDPAGEELSPRLEITSVAYALKSSVAENAVGDLTPRSITLDDGGLTAGAATLYADGTLEIGAATILPDGSIQVVGRQVITAGGELDPGALRVLTGPGLIGEGSPADPLMLDVVTLSELAGACSPNAVPHFDPVNGWACAPDIDTTYTAGVGLTLQPNEMFTADFNLVQRRIVESCAADEKLIDVENDGTIICLPDADTLYTAGVGLTLSGLEFALDDAVAHTDAEATAHAADPGAHHTRYANAEALLALASVAALPNLLGNAGFEHAQVPSASRTAVALWWSRGAFDAIAQDTAARSQGSASLQIDAVDATGFVYQAVENFEDYRGQIVTLSIDVLAGASGAVVELDDGVAPVSVVVANAPGFQRVTLSLSVDVAATRLAVRLFPGADASRFDAATLIVGELLTTGVPFIPTSPAEDQIRGLRWFEEGDLHWVTQDSWEDGPDLNDGVITLSVPKRIAPSLLFGETRYFCNDAYAGGGDISGTVASPAAIGLDIQSTDCSTTRCQLSTEMGGAIESKWCMFTMRWTAEVAETTY